MGVVRRTTVVILDGVLQQRAIDGERWLAPNREQLWALHVERHW